MLFQILLILIPQIAPYITYDYGEWRFLEFDSRTCNNQPGNNVITQNFNFNGTFANKPQLLIFITQQSLNKGSNEFTYYIDQIDKTFCTIRVKCLQEKSLISLTFKWVAVDDKRIQVINQFNKNVTNVASRTYTISHTLTYAKVAYVSPIDLGFTDPFSYKLDVTSFTSTQVNVDFVKGGTGLLSIGFQVVLGTDQAFLTNVARQLTSVPAATTQSETVTKPSGYQFFFQFIGLNWSYEDGLRIRVAQVDTDQTTTYRIETWGSSEYPFIRYKYIWFNLQNSVSYYPFLCQKWRVSKKQDYTGIKVQVYVEEINQFFIIGASETIIVPDTIRTFNLKASISCSSSSKISGYVRKCIGCISETQNINQNCYGGMNLIEFHFYLTQSEQTFQSVLIIVTASTITITQSVVVPQNDVLQLSLVKI